MPPDWGEPIPAAPFVSVINAELRRIAADDNLRLSDQSLEAPGMVILSDRLGIAERTLYRYKNSLDSVGEPTDSYARNRVEDMLDAMGVQFSDVYPEIAAAEDVELEDDAYCLICHEDVSPLAGRCPWCDTQVAKRPPRSIRRVGQGRRLTDAQVRQAHRLHWEKGLSLRELGRQLYKKAGYATAQSCANALSNAFAGMALKPRDRIDATVLVSTTHGHSKRNPQTAEELAAKAARRRELRAAQGTRCPHVTIYGHPCPNFTAPGLDTCRRHSAEGMRRNAENLSRARQLQVRGPLLSEQLIREAVAMHTRFGMSGERIAKVLQPRTRSASVPVVGRLVREALRARGLYEGYKRPHGNSGRFLADESEAA